MPDFSTPSGSNQPYIPLLKRDQRNRVPGTHKSFSTMSAAAAAFAQERTNIGMQLPVWFQNERVEIETEPTGVTRLWQLTTTAGSGSANAAASHARRFVVFSREFTLSDESNNILATNGEPTGGINGDYAVDAAAGVVYSKSISGTWTEVHRTGSTSGPSITVGTAPPDNDDGRPDDSIYIQVDS